MLFQQDFERAARSDDEAVEEQRLSRTEEQRLSRLAKQRTRAEDKRANETSMQTQQRRQRVKEHMQQRRQRDREHHAQSALQADMAIVDDGQQDLDVLPPSHHVLFQEDLERPARSDDMAVIDDGQQDLDVLPPSHRVLLQQDLERDARGEIPLKPLRMHKSFEQMVTAFLKKQFSQVLRTCTSCSERWWPESSERQAGLTYVNLSRLTEWSNLCIGKAIPLDRLTTKISSCKGMEERIAVQVFVNYNI